MFNNSNQNVNQQDNFQSNRLSLPSSSSLSFDVNNVMYDKYRHLEYHQKVQNILSNSQIPPNQQIINQNINRPHVHVPPFNTYNSFNASYNLSTPVNLFTNQILVNSFNISSQQNNSIANNQYVNNQNDNLICFDTHEDLNVFDVFDPLKNTQIKQESPLSVIKKAKEVESNMEAKKSETIKMDRTQKESLNLEIKNQPQLPIKTYELTNNTNKNSENAYFYSNEIEHFSKQIIQLKHSIDKDNQTSNLIVFSPVLESLLSSRKNLHINLSVRYYNDSEASNKRYQAGNITVSLNSSVETLAYHVLNMFEIKDLDISKYLFKIHGFEEYLPYNSTLAELKYFYECINENKEPILILIELKNANTMLSVKNRTNSIKFEPNIKIGVKYQMSKEKLESILKSISYNRNLLEASIGDEENFNFDRTLNRILNLKEKCMSLKSALFYIGHDMTEKLLFNLDFYYSKLKQLSNAKLLNEREPLMFNSIDYSYKIELPSNSNRLDQVLKSIQELISNILEHSVSFVECTISSFYSNLKIDTFSEDLLIKKLNLNTNNKEIIEIIQADEKLSIYFKGLSRLDQIFNKLYSAMSSPFDLYLRFSIVYGTRVFDKVNIKLDKFDKTSQRRTDSLIKLIKIQFDRLDLCILPREACLFIQLFSTNINSPNTPNGYNNFLSKENNLENIPCVSTMSSSSLIAFEDPTDKCLAWTSKSLFDDELYLENNEYFLSMFDDYPDISSVCCTSNNLYSENSPIVQIEFPKYNKLYRYPSVTYECECNLRDFQMLSNDRKDKLIDICNKSIVTHKLNQYEKDLINENYIYLNGIPFSLSKVYLSLLGYDFSSIIHFYAYLKQCEPLSVAESLELLMPQFPDQELRKHAIRSLELNTDETISLYLPQLLEALKYEKSHCSELALMLLRLSSKSLRFAHKLYWHLREFRSREKDFMMIRYLLIYDALKMFFNAQMIQEIKQEVFLVEKIDQIALKDKEAKDNDRLLDDLDILQKEWFGEKNSNSTGSCRLPFDISYCVKEIDIKSCSFINSFTMPVKLVFKNFDATANSFYTIYKIGDDLRQDSFVLQMINVMNKLWLAEDLDLNLVTFQCLQTGNRRGFIEMITNAETLKEIQKGHVINAFKRNCIDDWLRSHNPKLNNFKKAVENFTRSCAAYSIATYLLGIGDRHNDNIMIKYTGHMFHIDFGKYLGDLQKFAGFKRDRTPILFTSDMFYVINQGKEPNYRFQEFIELCCKAFQILRKNYNHILSLIELMIDSDIPGLNRNAIQYVYKNLMMDLNEDESSNSLKKLIYDSLGNFASINFAIHTLAQPKTVSSSNYFSFNTHVFNSETDSKILNVVMEKSETTNFSNRKELIKCIVTRESDFESNQVYRTFEEFCELYNLLLKTFPSIKLTDTPSYNKFKESKPFLKRCLLVESFLKEIMNFNGEISQSDIIYTFFHPILRDKNQEIICTTENSSVLTEDDNQFEGADMYQPDIKGEVKLKLRYKDNKFYVNCLQCRNLKAPMNQSNSSLKPYVKCYLRPDYKKSTKKKVQALFNGANPIFTETMEYDISISDLKNRTLELSVLNNKINLKEKIGSIEIRLYDINWENDYVKWYYLR